MSFIKYAVPALAAAGQAVAAQCSASTTTIQNQGDATALSGCTTFTGSIAIATNTANDISLDGVQSITGDLTAINAIGVTSISAGSLTNIGGTMQFVNMTVLNALNFPRLTTSHNIDWETLPALQGLGFTSGIQSTDILSIQDTQLQNLDGINPTTAGQIYISNNRYLTDINMQVANVTTNITIQSNNNGETNISFPNLVHATAMIVSQAAFLNFPALQYVNGTMSIYSNAFTTFGCPNLTSTGGLSIATNRELTNISFPALTMVGMNGISIMDNQALTDTITFPVLTRIAGAITVAGDFTGVSLPAIKQIAGASNITSSANIASTCQQFTGTGTGQLGGGVNGVIQGANNCKGASGTATASGSSTRASSTSTTRSAGTMATIPLSFVLAGSGLAAALFGLW